MQLIIVCFAFISNIFLGLITFRNNPKSVTHRLLGLITLVISLWMVTNYLSLIGYNAEFTLFWIRMVMLVTTPLGPLIYLFLYSFPYSQINISDRKITILTLSTFIVGILSFSPLTFSAVSLVSGIHPIAGPGIIFYGLHTGIFLFTGFRSIYKKYIVSKGLVRLQMKYLIFGFVLTFSLMFITNFVFVVFLNNSNFVILGPVFILILLGFITYSIIKHRLMDIRLVLARTVSYSILISLIISFYTTVVYIIGNLLIPGSFSQNQLFIPILLSLIIANTLEPIKKYIERKTDKFFFQNAYDRDELLRKISHILSSTIELNQLTKKITNQLISSLKIEKIDILLKDNKFQTVRFLSRKEETGILSSRHQLVVFDYLAENELKGIMRDHAYSVLINLETKDRSIGFLLIGNKLSGDIYDSNDLKMFEILGPQLAIAIQNSQRYEEIKNFSEKLKIEIIKATTDLKQANLKLKELDVLKDEFVSVASHELRTPMTAIKSYLWMALSGQGGPLKEKQKFYLQRSYDSTDRLIKLVNDMLNISRIESGRMSLELNTLDLIKLVEDVVEEISSRANELGIKVKITKTANLPEVIADADKIREVIVNLVGNSFKFTPKNGTITISFSVKDDCVITKVADTGSGLTPDMIKNLFKKFGLIKGSYQTNKTSSVEGTGLGLYICQQVLKLHGGDIWATSKGIGQGSEFSFSLPVSSSKKLKLYQQKFQHPSNVGIIHSKI